MNAGLNSLKRLVVAYSDSDEEDISTVLPSLQPGKEKGVKRTRNDSFTADSSERMKLEIPSGVLDMFKNSELSTGSQSAPEHQGRERSFDHFPGNWATHVLVPFELPESFSEFVASLKGVWPEEASELHVNDLDDIHVSISRTVPIRHHWIDPLKDILQRGFNGRRSPMGALPLTNKIRLALARVKYQKEQYRFVCDFPTIGVYVNDEKTRTFLALEVDLGVSQLKDLVAVVDKTFQEFGLPKYYEKPSFHASFSWSLGDISVLLQSHTLTKMQAILDSYAEETSPLVFTAREIQCRTGNKVFHFSLTGEN